MYWALVMKATLCSAVKLWWDIKSSPWLSVFSIEGRDRTKKKKRTTIKGSCTITFSSVEGKHIKAFDRGKCKIKPLKYVKVKQHE